MGNLCCRRVVYSPNGADALDRRDTQPPKATMYRGDDCAIDELLEGRMDLDVLVPDGRRVRLTVERRTPMMDLLVQAASATKISPGGHVIHVTGDKEGTLHYKPSTPIGSLDTNIVRIVPKGQLTEAKPPRAPGRPFEPTFRVQVHLPRNQLTVCRMSPRVRISELRDLVCREKSLDASRYQLVRPGDPAQPLPPDMTLAEYGATEVTLLSNSCIESHISQSHILPYTKRTGDQRRAGILRLLVEDKANTVHNIERKQCPATHQGRYKPKKRRPAPPPPPPPFHSRQSSSDSSGYHEATSSFLHDSDKPLSSDSSGVSSLDAKLTTAPPKKRKAPPPPPAQEDQPVISQESSNSEEEEACIQDELLVQPVEDDHGVSEAEQEAFEPPRAPDPFADTDDEEEKPPAEPPDGAESVTPSVLRALSARLEQDVTRREIASGIRAAFHSLESGTAAGDPEPTCEQTPQPTSSPDVVDSQPDEEEVLLTCDEVPQPIWIRSEDSQPISAGEDIAQSSSTSEEAPQVVTAGDEFRHHEEPRQQQPLHRSLRRSASLLSVREVQKSSESQPSQSESIELEAEQERLRQEYEKLQRQFLVWQKQLLSNHAMLREERIVPFARTHSLPEGEHYPPPLVSRSLSYEPNGNRCSTLPRSAINIDFPELGSLSSSLGTLRSSKTKSHFKPPQIRASTESRQRLPPQVKKDGQLDMSDDAQILSTILPSFRNLNLLEEGPPVQAGTMKPEKQGDPKVNSQGQSKHVQNVNGTNLVHPPSPPPLPVADPPKVVQSTRRPEITKRPDNCVDPRSQLMLEIRKFGGRTSLRKISLAS